MSAPESFKKKAARNAELAKKADAAEKAAVAQEDPDLGQRDLRHRPLLRQGLDRQSLACAGLRLLALLPPGKLSGWPQAPSLAATRWRARCGTR